MVNLVDVDNDKMIDSEDIELTEKFLELDLREKKAKSQEKMAWLVIVSMIIFIAIILSPLVSIQRVNALSDLFGLYFISVSGILAAYFGTQAWISNSALNNSNHDNIVINKNGKYSGSKRIPRSD